MDSPEKENLQKAMPWGIWPTLGFSGAIGVIFILAQTITAFIFIVTLKTINPGTDIARSAESLQSNGLLISLASFITGPLTIALVILFSKIRENITLKQYLCLNRVNLKDIIKWGGLMILFAACSDTLTFFLKRPVIPQFMINAYTTIGFKPLIWLALVFVSPVAEEFFFRGFLFTGIKNTKAGSVGAVIITALVWAMIHGQYNIYEISLIFSGGLMLGIARIKSYSIYIPVFMHIVWNSIAASEVAIYLMLAR